MSKHNYDDDYEDGYDDDYDETLEYVRKVKDQLKGMKITDAQIVRKLEQTNYDIKKTVAALKPKDVKVGSAPQAKAAPSTGAKVGATPTVAGAKTVKADAAPAATSTAPVIAAHGHSSSSHVFTSPDLASPVKGELLLSDDEEVVTTGGPEKGKATPSNESHHPITMVVTGHVDAGKSTVVGHLLYKCGQVNQRTIHKYEKDSKAIGKASFALAWVTDESQAEREHGVTIDVAERVLKTDHRVVTILDTPGHRDFIPNMIKGACQADVALLVVPAAEGEFESSMKDGAQTREHATLLKALGVSQIIVVVNKMDCTSPQPWSQARCATIEAEMRSLLCGEMRYPDRLVRVVPLSGLTGENIVARSESCPLSAWYEGPTLVQAIDSFLVPARSAQKPLRAVVQEVVSTDLAHGRLDLVVSVLQGTLRCDRTLAFYSSASTVAPAAKDAAESASAVGKSGGTAILGMDSATHSKPTVVTCTALSKGNASPAVATTGSGTGSGDTVAVLRAGERGRITICNKYMKGIELGVREGSVLFKGPGVPTMSRSFKASISTMADLVPPLIPGSCLELYLYGAEVECRVTKLLSMVSADKHAAGAGAADIVKNPKCVPGSAQAIVTITLEAPVLIEPATGCRALARFALRAKGKTVAVGVCETLS